MKFKFLHTFLPFLLVFMSHILFAQSNIGLPIIKNYPKEVYNGGLQTWEIQQDKYGRLYFANNEGLLIFDGENWQKVHVDNKTIVRSLLIDEERIYVGSQGDFGYFEPDKKGMLQYFSLKAIVEQQHQNFADVWDIVKAKNQIIFRTDSKILTYSSNRIQTIESDEKYEYLGKIDGKVFYHSSKDGIKNIKNKNVKTLKNTAAFTDKVITGIITLNDTTLLISTLKNGFFHYNGSEVKNGKSILLSNKIESIVRSRLTKNK